MVRDAIQIGSRDHGPYFARTAITGGSGLGTPERQGAITGGSGLGTLDLGKILLSGPAAPGGQKTPPKNVPGSRPAAPEGKNSPEGWCNREAAPKAAVRKPSDHGSVITGPEGRPHKLRNNSQPRRLKCQNPMKGQLRELMQIPIKGQPRS